MLRPAQLYETAGQYDVQIPRWLRGPGASMRSQPVAVERSLSAVLHALREAKALRGDGGAPSHHATAVGWDAFHRVEVLPTQPPMVVVGDKPGAFGSYRDGVEIIRRARSEKKELVVPEGWSHYDLYDQPEPVAQALAKLVPFYRENL